MSEEEATVSPRLRVMLIALVLTNVLFFGYAILAPDPTATAVKRIEELQINPNRIKLKGTATRGPAGSAASKGGAYRACLEWGPFSGSDAARAETALGRLGLAQPPVQRTVADPGTAKRFAYFVREPEAATVAQIAELQRGFPGTAIKAGPCPFS